MDRVIAHLIATKLLLVLLLIVTSPLWLAAVLLAEFLEGCDGFSVIVWVIQLAVLIFALVLWWLSDLMAYSMTIEELNLKDGVKVGHREAQMQLMSLPMVGRWFVDTRQAENGLGGVE